MEIVIKRSGIKVERGRNAFYFYQDTFYVHQRK